MIREGPFEGQHTKQVELGLRMGMVLFIVSEIMFFVRRVYGSYFPDFSLPATP